MPNSVTVPLPGAAHPAFSADDVSRVLSSPVQQGNIVKVIDERTGMVSVFRPVGIQLVYQYVVWTDEQGRGIAQVEGQFPNLREGDVLAMPVFANRHVELTVQ